MVKKVGFKSLYYDIMYVIGDHAYQYFETIPCIDSYGLTRRQNFWWNVYQFCIVRGMPDNQEIYYTSIHNEDNCRDTVRFYDGLDEAEGESVCS